MLCRLQEELHLMENLVLDNDFMMILLSSLPGSWDTFAAAYLGLKTKGRWLTSHGRTMTKNESQRLLHQENGAWLACPDISANHMTF